MSTFEGMPGAQGDTQGSPDAGEGVAPEGPTSNLAPAPAFMLRDPAHRVAPNAPAYWRTGAAVGWSFLLVPLTVAWGVWMALGTVPWWGHLIAALFWVWALLTILVMPGWRYRVHRWEVTPTAVYTRSGWLTQESRVAPLSRVQTVDTERGPVMRWFGLTNITVTTASSAGPVVIEALDDERAQVVLAELTAATERMRGDAT